MRSEALERLTLSMRSQQIEIQLFEHRHGRAAFDVFFFVGNPSEMLIGARAAQPPLAIDIEVRPGGHFNPFLGDQYRGLCDFLGIRPNPENPFSPSAFFREMEPSIPPIARAACCPTPQTIATYRKVDEAHKRHFMGWHHNTMRGTSVTRENLEKTRKLLGWNAFRLCERANISSCWTDDPARAVDVDLRALQGRR